MTGAGVKQKELAGVVKKSAYPLVGASSVMVGGSSASESVLGSPDEAFRLGVPRRGHVLSTVVETYGKPIREAVGILCGSLTKKQCSGVRTSLFVPCGDRPEPDFLRSDAEMAAWAIVSIWIVGTAVKVLAPAASLVEAEQWFFGSSASERLTSLPSDDAIERAQAVLGQQVDAPAYFELLPYLLDPHGPGSRLSIRRDPATNVARKRKQAKGVFYTPSDVAEFMADACMAVVNSVKAPTIFDPACGTGVFLRAALRRLLRQRVDRGAFSLASDCLFGADTDPWPLDATAFVLLADCWDDLEGERRPPVEAWQRLRMNLACIDTLRIDSAGTMPSAEDKNFRNDMAQGRRVSISRLFPTLERGPTVILGNPPYANLGRRSDLAELSRVYKSVAIKPYHNAEIYLPFVEQMIRLAHREICSGALVLPLSMACNLGPQFSTTRELISKTPGRWRFAFFDREPHALFGEDVKTRNAIILWSRASWDKSAVLSTGPLRKWRGDQRAVMFKSLQFTVFDGDIRNGIPKFEGAGQAAAFRTLSMRRGRLKQVASIRRIRLAEIWNGDGQTVFVGSTAYNFLNVFLTPKRSIPLDARALSENPLHAVTCASSKDALAMFAILSSHLAYWWWHTHGDGFHVSNHFIAELPFGLEDFNEEVIATLSEHGADLWSSVETKPIISLNRGRTSLAYSPNGHNDIRRRVDQVLAGLAGLDSAFVNELQQFTARTVAATLNERAMTETEEGD